jgi:hypothetical protein
MMDEGLPKDVAPAIASITDDAQTKRRTPHTRPCAGLARILTATKNLILAHCSGPKISELPDFLLHLMVFPLSSNIFVSNKVP